MSGSVVRYDVLDGVAQITLNRPKRCNALNGQMLVELLDILTQIEQAEQGEIRAVVLTGEGKFFCSGMDIGSPMKEGANPAQMYIDVCHRLQLLPVPTIARINGPAIGGGLGLMFVCDIRVVSEYAYFQFSEVRIGFVPAVISTFIVPQMGLFVAKELMMTGRRFTPQECMRWSVVSSVVQLPELDGAVDKVVNDIRKGGPVAITTVKQLTQFVSANSHTDSIAEASRVFKIAISGPEAQHGFAEVISGKQKPDWAAFYSQGRSKL
jgi:methylglutaconyl-CoA hydratase